MTIKFLFVFCLFIAAQFITKAQSALSLAGDWQIKLDPTNIGEKENWATKKFNEKIKLPGTTDEAGYGEKNIAVNEGFLSRPYKYVGAVWYSREINIPKHWQGKSINLLLERVIWQSKVYLDGKPMGVKDALSVQHLHPLGQLTAGRHWLSIRIDNDLI